MHLLNAKILSPASSEGTPFSSSARMQPGSLQRSMLPIPLYNLFCKFPTGLLARSITAISPRPRRTLVARLRMLIRISKQS